MLPPLVAKCKTFLGIKGSTLSAVMKIKALEDFFLVFMFYFAKFIA